MKTIFSPSCSALRTLFGLCTATFALPNVTPDSKAASIVIGDLGDPQDGGIEFVDGATDLASIKYDDPSSTLLIDSLGAMRFSALGYTRVESLLGSLDVAAEDDLYMVPTRAI